MFEPAVCHFSLQLFTPVVFSVLTALWETVLYIQCIQYSLREDISLKVLVYYYVQACMPGRSRSQNIVLCFLAKHAKDSASPIAHAQAVYVPYPAR